MKINNIAKALVGGFLLFGAMACTDEVKYTPEGAVQGEGVYFSAEASSTVDIPADATELSIPVYRTNAEGSFTLDVTASLTDEDGAPVTGIFTVPSTVVFADGVSEGKFTLGVDFSKVVPEEVYYLHLTLPAGIVSPYGIGEQTFELTYAPWSEWEVINGAADPGYYQQSVLWSNYYPTYVYYRESLTNKDRCQYAVDSPFSDLDYQIIWSMDKSDKITVDGQEVIRVKGDNCVNTTVNSSNGVPYMYTEMYWWYINILGGTPANYESFLERNEIVGSYYNPVQGRFYLNMVVYDDALEPGYTYGNGYETLQLAGDFKEYFLTFNYVGNYVDVKGNETAIINASRSEDVSSFSYTVLPGKLTETEVADAIADLVQDPEAQLYYDLSTNISVVCDEEGEYTIVGAGFNDKGAQVCDGSLTFTYNSVQKESDWESLGWVEYTDGILWGRWSFKDGGYLGGDVMECEVEKSKVEPDMYRLVNPYKDLGEAYDMALDGDYYITFSIINGGVIIWESPLGLQNPTGNTASRGNLGVYSYAENFYRRGETLEDIAASQFAGKLNNGVITFNAGILFLTYEGDDGLYYSNFSQAMLDAFNNDTFNPNLLPTGYGLGKTCIDMSSIMNTSRARATRSVNFHKGNIRSVVEHNSVKVDGIKKSGKFNGIRTSMIKSSAKDGGMYRFKF